MVYISWHFLPKFIWTEIQKTNLYLRENIFTRFVSLSRIFLAANCFGVTTKVMWIEVSSENYLLRASSSQGYRKIKSSQIQFGLQYAIMCTTLFKKERTIKKIMLYYKVLIVGGIFSCNQYFYLLALPILFKHGCICKTRVMCRTRGFQKCKH